MSWTEVGLKGLELMSPLLLAALTWAAAKGAQLINAHIKNSYLKGVLTRLDYSIIASIKEVQQVTVDAIKAASEDGTLSAEDRARVKREAVSSVRCYLGRKGLAELAKVLGLSSDIVDMLIDTRIEAAVHDLKLARAAVAGPALTAGVPSPLAAT